MHMKTKLERQQDAALRNEMRAARTPKQQLARLDHLLGKGQGAKRERRRLLEQINNQ